MKKWLCSALIMLLVGCVMLGIAIKNDDAAEFIEASKAYETEVYEITEAVESVFVHGSDQDIKILPAEDGKCRLEYSKGKHDRYEIAFEDGALSVEKSEEFHIQLLPEFDGGEIKLYLSEGEYNELKIRAASSDVYVAEGFLFENVAIDLSSGDVSIHADVGKVMIDTASGDVALCNMAADKIEIGTASGDVSFEGLDAGGIFISTASGDVEGSVVKPMLYETDTASGDVDVPVSMRDAEICRIETASGDIVIREE